VNLVILNGRMGKDPEEIKSKVPGCRFSLATSKYFKKKGEEKGQEKTSWHNIQVWGDQARFALKFLKKGMRVAIQGELDYNEVNGKTYTNVVARVIEPMWDKREAQADGKPEEEVKGLGDAEHSSDDDIPF
jgi:single-strand DNA-binding protein